ncbi:MAG: O-antigen ligase family protein [Elusimicrobia bacterium]|nr:O-antigen ligase family protein [Elusimicrobiota bacterium]
MANPKRHQQQAVVKDVSAPAASFAHKALVWWLPILYLLISDSFYLRTYDSAQVKITLVQMGGVCLLALWICRLLEEGRRAFTKTDLVTLAPFLASFAYGIFSYIHAPYKFSSLDFFLRRVFYLTVPLIVIREFSESATERTTRILIWTCAISVGYGFLQWFDISFFPPGPGRGPDPFIWRGAFGERVFSTFGNPNFFADYLVIMFPILVTQYLKTREFKILPILFLDLFCLWYTVTKGAWIGFAISLILLISTFSWFFAHEFIERHWKKLALSFALFGALVLGAVYNKLAHSAFTSVNFRLFTWEATWEMIRSQPLIGTGIGSFWVIYPAFRRPPIFHIEGKHNTETDHSENEHLEVLFDEGIIGFGIFYWLIISTCVVAYRSLSQLTGSLKKGQRAPPHAYDLLGYLIAFQGMLIHNLFDVSMRFVSSGVYLGLLSGLIVNLSRGVALIELHQVRESGEQAPAVPPGPSLLETFSQFFIWPARLAAWGGLAYASWKIFSEYSVLQGPVSQLGYGGEVLQWWIAWSCFLFCAGGQLFIFARTVQLSRNVLVPVTAGLMLWPLYLTWGHFKADVHHNIAIFFSKRQEWDMALKNYLIVGRLNPAFVMANYFKGNVFNDRFNMTKLYNENWGDKDKKPRDDFERALDAYAEVRAQAPNYVQMHHQMGVLYMKKADYDRGRGDAAQAEKDLDEAIRHFTLYYNLDPVFPPNYYRLGHIYMLRRHYDKAAETYKEFLDAVKCAVDEKLSSKPWLRRSILAYQPLQDRGGAWTHRHDVPDAYLQLGNAYFLGGRIAEAEKAFRDGLKADPKNENLQRNLQVLLMRGKSPAAPAPIVPPSASPQGMPLLEIERR